MSHVFRVGGCTREPSLLFLVVEGEGCGIDAIALARRLRSVGENVAKMTAAIRTGDFGAHHAVTAVGMCIDRRIWKRLKETRPAGSRIILGLGSKQRRAAARAFEDTLAFERIVFAGERPLRALFAQNTVLLRGQLPAPLLFGLFDFGHSQP